MLDGDGLCAGYGRRHAGLHLSEQQRRDGSAERQVIAQNMLVVVIDSQNIAAVPYRQGYGLHRLLRPGR